MEFKLLHIYTLLSLALLGSHAMSPEVYWKSLVPNSPMPKAVKVLLETTEEWDDTNEKGYDFTDNDPMDIQLKDHPYSYVASTNQLNDYPETKLLFLENDLHQGGELKLLFTKENQKTAFLPKELSDSIPFSSKDLPEIYNTFSVKPDSVEAKILKQTLNFCELKPISGEEIYCATSLENMVGFSTAKLEGENVRAVSTEVNDKESTPSQKYRIGLVKKLAADKAVVCHKQNYAYAVFYCHVSVGTRSYEVSLVGEDGTKAKAVAVCDMATSPVCHFLPEDHVLWVPY